MRNLFIALFLILFLVSATGSSYAQQHGLSFWKDECPTPWGTTILAGQSVTAYQSPSGPACGGGCVSEVRTCSGNQLSGSYTYQSCSGGTCGGTCVGGYCWYGTVESCDNFCAGHGGCNLVGTRDYAGSNGTDANCQNVVSSYTGYPWGGTSAHNQGCVLEFIPYPPWANVKRGTNPTDCSATPSSPVIGRYCACNN